MEVLVKEKEESKPIVQTNHEMLIPFYIGTVLILSTVLLSIASSNQAKKNGIKIQTSTQINYPL